MSNEQENIQEGAKAPLTDDELREKVIDVLHTCYDPEIPVDIYELGLIYKIDVMPVNNIMVEMTLTSPMCPVAESLPAEVQEKIKGMPEVNDAQVEVVFDPPWEQDMMSEAARLELGFM